MMLIICDKSPDKAVDWLVENTSKSFVFKQTLELAQLICSCGLSNVYKKLNQAKELKEWIKYYNIWTQNYFYKLVDWCENNINLSEKTIKDWHKIRADIIINGDYRIKFLYPKTAIWRYSKEYESKYPTNSELPIDVAVEEYKKYLDWKFKKEDV